MASNIENVSFQTLDGAILPYNELLRHCNSIPFMMVLKTKNAGGNALKYAINLNQNFSISNRNESKIGEEKYLEYCVGIGLPTRDSYFMANFASKLHQTLPHSRFFTAQDILLGL